MPSLGNYLSFNDLSIANNFHADYFLVAQMDNFGRRLRRLMDDKGIQSKDLAARIGVAPSRISKWRKGGVTPNAENVRRLAAGLGVAVPLLDPDRDQSGHTSTGEHEGSEVEPFDRDITRGYKKHDVPVVGDAEASTNGFIAWDEEGIVSADVEEWVSRSFADGDPKAYALRVRGDSMIPRYYPGEIVVAQPRLPVRDGDFACVILTTGERLVKRVFRKDAAMLLVSLNSVYPERLVHRDDIHAMHRIKHSITST